MITARFSPDRPVSSAQGKHGELIVVQGHGVRPIRTDGEIPGVDAGMDAPAVAPTIAVNTPARYYVARTDVYKPGLCYYEAPAVTFSSSKGVDAAYGRVAKASAFLNQSSLGEVRIDDGGKHYLDQPSVELSETYGKGAVLEATLDGVGAGTGSGDPYTGITEWKIVQAPPYINSAGVDDYKTWYYAENGETEISLTETQSPPPSSGVRFGVPQGGLWNGLINCSSVGAKDGFSYTVSGGSGTGASVALTFSGAEWSCSIGTSATLWRGARTLLSVRAVNYGSGYKDEDIVVVRIKSGSGDSDRDIILHGIASGNAQNTAAPTHSVQSVTIKSGGSGYLVAPQIKFLSNSGFGAYATCKVKDGKIVSVTLENCGGGYKTPPSIEVVSGGAEVFAVARPHLRGKYQCYYRYIDDTPESQGGPIPSNLSPVLEVDAGEGAQSISWVVPQPTGRAKKLELWRTTSNQATTLYRVASMELTGVDPVAPPPTPPGGVPPTNPPPQPTPPTSSITIQQQPQFTAYPVVDHRGEVTEIWYDAWCIATGPGTLTFQWQCENEWFENWFYKRVWIDVTPEYIEGLGFIRRGTVPVNVYSALADRSRLRVGMGSTLTSSNIQPVDGFGQNWRCVISSSTPGVTPVTTSIACPEGWNFPPF